MIASSEDVVLRVSGVSKTFPGTRALRNVGLEIVAGEVHALVGQNGSGKSTLVKILAGYHRPDPGGSAWLDDEPIDLAASADERHDRLRFVHQDLGLVLELSAMENLALSRGFHRSRFGRVHWAEQARMTRALLARFDAGIDIYRPLSTVTPVERTIVAVALALHGWEGGRGILVLDEPTAVLPPNEVAHLFNVVNAIKETGTGVLYVSHRMGEIFELADRVSVMRDGSLIATRNLSQVSPRELASLMIGEDLDDDLHVDAVSNAGAPTALEVRSLHARWLRGASFVLRRGEILGLAGLLGSGREEVPYAVAGALGRAAGGTVRIAEGAWRSVSDLAGAIPLVPADRATEAVVPDFGVGENLTLSVLDRLTQRGRLDRRHERRAGQKWVAQLGIRTAGLEAPITTLSGGNQQKVIMARCLAQEAPAVLLCEPTAGVDIGTRAALYALIAAQAREGLAVLISSADVDELVAICTRVLVFRHGVIVRELTETDLTESEVLHAMEGTDQE